VSGERRFERLRPDALAALQAAAPIAYVPLGPLEYHGPHLPTGVDAFEAHGICLRAAEVSGGVVLPASHLASGCLDLPYTLDFPPDLVEAWARVTVTGLLTRGYRVVVVLTGHGPLDLIHLLKRVAAETERDPATPAGCRVHALCWLELNAARATSQDDGEPTIVDHAALVETSWMLHLHPDLVRLEALSDDPDAVHLGVYGRNPRFTATAAFGAAQVEAAARLLGDRAVDLLHGARPDTLADLRRFVAVAWPERLRLTGRAGTAGEAAILIENPGRASRYISGMSVQLDGRPLDPAGVTLRNTSPGETGRPVAAADLGPEHGFYVRRGQLATLHPGPAVPPGVHRVRLEVRLGGVSEDILEEDLPFTP